MSKHLTVTATIELLESIKAIVREFAAAEEKINKEYRTKSEAAEKRFQEELAAYDVGVAERVHVAEEAFSATQAGLIARHDVRKERLTKAHKAAKKRLGERIDNEEGRRRYQSQKGLLDTQRWRTESLGQNDQTLATFQQNLTEVRNRFVELEQAAAKAARGYPSFRRSIEKAQPAANADLSRDEYQLLEELQHLHTRAVEDLEKFRKLLLPKLFGALPLWLWLVVGGLCAGVPALEKVGIHALSYVQGGAAAGAIWLFAIAGYFIGRSQGASLIQAIGAELETARRLYNACLEKSQARHAAEIARIEAESKTRIESFQLNWQEGTEQAAAARDLWPGQLDEKWQRAFATCERLHAGRMNALEEQHQARLGAARTDDAARRQQLIDVHHARVEKFRADYFAHWEKLQADWKARLQPLEAAVESANAAAREFLPWREELWQGWAPPTTFGNAARFATLEVDLKKFAEALPRDVRLPIAPQISLPLVLNYPQQGSLLFETTRAGNEAVFDALNNVIFRLLATTPAGKLSFTLIDPVKLGQNFSTVMHLADYEDNVINGRIWTQPTQIEERLADLNEHMEKVIQMYLRNEYETIAEYNIQAGNIAEKYHFVVVADFPANFTETAVKRLLRIAASGARCGVFTLIHWDHRHTAPPDFFPEELRRSSVCITAAGEQFVLAHPLVSGARVLLDPPPSPEFATGFLHKVGQSSRGSNRVEVPFEQVAPSEAELWSANTVDELRVPIGRSGATKLQYLAIGKGTRQHALVAGKTGSGKSTLFHVIITNLALWCSPEQVEFYLVDFKRGVEFKSYATRRLPHAKVVAIESDREFGLSVLQRLDDELKRRGELFRKLGVQDLAGYKRSGGPEPMPRCILLIDEFQEFFVEDDRISQAANLLLDRIVRQGRAFGIHVVLGSQTLGGAYTLARTTIGQMVIRIALQCNEADAYLIMDETNAAPRLLSRPGEGIYNDMGGAVEGNSPFQAVWLDDEERDRCLQRVRDEADVRAPAYTGPIVFEGNAPADVRDNPLLRQVLAAPPAQAPATARAWLGAPNSIKGPTEVVFQNRSGNNLMIVGQRDEAVLALVSVSLAALAAQFPPGTAKFVLFESTAPGSPERAYIESVAAGIPNDLTLAKPGDLGGILNQLVEDLQARSSGSRGGAPTTFLFIHGLQNFKKLRQDDDFGFSSDDGGANPAAQLLKLINEGPSHGIHVIATLDTYNNVNRFLGRKSLSEFELRVLFQMSANDSASLCDDPKAGTLGLHRALLYNEQEGYLETFRPYALPDPAWLKPATKGG